MVNITRLSFIICLLTGLAATAVLSQSADQQVWEAVRGTGDAEALENFIRVFPDSALVAEAEAELQRLEEAEQRRATEDRIFAGIGQVTYDAPLAFGGPSVLGKTLEQLITSTPDFPPIEGLPEALWKSETCGNCHQWDRVSLCEQAQVYNQLDPADYQFKQHPFGGTLKINLRNWAQGDCP